MRKYKNYIVLLLVCTFVYMMQIMYETSHEVERLPILGYHHIALDEVADTYFPNNMWVVKESDFKKQMAYLKEHGYHTMTLDEVYEWKKGNKPLPNKSVVITFDDGFLSSIHYAEPILKEYDFVGSVFAIASDVKRHGAYDEQKRQHASLDDIAKSSLAFYSHTYDLHHKDQGFKVNQLNKEKLREDITKSNEIVNGDYVAYPYGKYNTNIIEVLKEEGTKLAFGYNENRKATKADGDYQIPRFNVNRFTTLAAFQAMLEE